ncbi:unnamed protein product [Diamesa serratosioi]
MKVSVIFLVLAACIVALILTVILFVASESISNETLQEWNSFQIKFNKKYANEAEMRERLKIFASNHKVIVKHNLDYDSNDVSYKMGINEYTDMLPREVQLGDAPEPEMKEFEITDYDIRYFDDEEMMKLPREIDWRALGAVTSVKNQLPCGSCYAFSVLGSLEGQHFRRTGKLVSLSAQNVVDCTNTYGNVGCKGGSGMLSLQYIIDNGGVATEESYPYEGVEGKCRFDLNTMKIGASCNATSIVTSYDEDALKNAVATIGPISVGIVARNSFQHYESGIYYDPDCIKSKINHLVLVVGYGTDNKSNQDYWIVKNSFGTNWGVAGYIKMARNRDNNCEIASEARYPYVNVDNVSPFKTFADYFAKQTTIH